MINLNRPELVKLCHDLELSLVVLFGSQAQGKAKKESDVDIAVLSDRKSLEVDYQSQAWETFLWLLQRSDVDVIFLNHVSPLLGYKIAITGQLLHESRPQLWHNFRLMAVKRHSEAHKFYDLKKRYVRLMANDLEAATMLDEIYITEKLAVLSQHLNDLRQVARRSYEEYSNDLFVKRTGERMIELIVECAVDINNHFIVEVGLKSPSEYFRSFLEMSNLGIISESLSNALAPTAGLRNRLAHEYEAIADRIVYNAIERMISNYSEYISRILLWLSKNKK